MEALEQLQDSKVPGFESSTQKNDDELTFNRTPMGQLSPLSLPGSSSTAVKGRNVHQCYTDVCSSNPCTNGGTCIPYGASFM
jgi:hypothetical protein